MCSRQVYTYIARNSIQFWLYITLIQPFPRLSRLTTILRVGWLIWLIVLIFGNLSYLISDSYENLGYLVGYASFIIDILTNTAIFVEIICKQKHYQRLIQLEYEVDALLQQQTDINSIESNVWRKVFYQLIIHTTCDALHLVVAAMYYKSPVYYFNIPLLTVARIRYAQITLFIERQNQRTRCLIRALLVLVKANRPKHKFTSDIWQPYAVWEYDHLNWLRLVQGRLYELYQGVSECFGWSIISLLFGAFFTIVSNLFWCIEIWKYNFQLGQFAYDALNIIRVGTFAAILLTAADNARRKHMLISGLIFKLPKPLGNKVYNDLVSNIALQCLHQGFGISVKGFFNLNLSLLGDMIALIVTHLVILVQFLLSEEVIRKKISSFKFLSNTTGGT
ncbi:gustatory receptor 23a-like [Rhagoletis pomonella]|uniref:gustatory receptor 23a-like n=1 Tax=Rhagoletis pomonella TaxID=28610 RepID=UPI001780C92E|nr:gustatory receptor 23a-like [Rhagoletis pomonella]